MIGLLMNAFLADQDIIALDDVNTEIPGGFMDHNWKQLYMQFTYVVACTAYTFVVTALLAKAVDMVPGLRLRGTFEEEALGMDEVEVSSCF
jgi:ammonium transporter, Amt family